MMRVALPVIGIVAIQLVVQPDWSFELLLVVLFSMVLHELGHVVTALALGDSTARDAGRLSLNPLRHLDWKGFYAVPVDFRRLGHEAALLVVLAGPFVNLALALFMTSAAPVRAFWWQAGMVNLVLAGFNLLPIPPLDGDKALQLLVFKEVR